jgi:tellurite resistance protein
MNMLRTSSVPAVPAAFFAMVLGLAGLAYSWRVAHRIWGYPGIIGELLMLLAALVWAVLMLLYAAKWIGKRDAAVKELSDPIQCCYVGLIGVTTMLIAGGLLPYASVAAQILFTLGACFTGLFAIWRTGALWQGGRDPGTITAVLYLPLGAGSFVMASGLGALGHEDWGQLAFGAGLFSWLAIESVLLQRLLIAQPLPLALRPTLGIQLAPPTVGALAYLNVTNGAPDVLVHAMVGYGVLQALIAIRMFPWVRQQPFAPGYWAFSFGITALATDLLRLIERGDRGAAAFLAPYAFGIANVVVAALILGTIRLSAQHRLLPVPAGPVPLPVAPILGQDHGLK